MLERYFNPDDASDPLVTHITGFDIVPELAEATRPYLLEKKGWFNTSRIAIHRADTGNVTS